MDDGKSGKRIGIVAKLVRHLAFNERMWGFESLRSHLLLERMPA